MCQVDGPLEGDGFYFLGFLLDAGEDEVAAAGAVGLVAQLEDVEQFVLDVGEMAADDAGGLLVGDDFAQPEVVQQRQCHPDGQRGAGDCHEGEEQGFPDGGAEVKVILHEVEPQKQQ